MKRDTLSSQTPERRGFNPPPSDLRSLCQIEFAPVKFKGGVEVGQQVRDAVSARVEVEFVGNLERIERLVQFARTAVEAVGIFRAAIEVNFHFQKRRRIFPRQHEGAVQIPEVPIDRIAKHFCEQLRSQIP